MTGNWLIAIAIMSSAVVASIAIICYGVYRSGRN